GARRRPFHHALCCRHEGKTTFCIFAEQAKIGRGVADAEHPQSSASGPQPTNPATDETPRHRAKWMSVEIAQVNDIHAIGYHGSNPEGRKAAQPAAGMLQIFRQQIMACTMNTTSDAPSNAQTRLFLCLKDNYGVLVHDPASGATAAIDAPESAAVEAAL